MEKWYNLKEAAHLLGIKVRTARQWVHDGKLHATKYENAHFWVVSETEIMKLRGEVNADEN